MNNTIFTILIKPLKPDAQHHLNSSILEFAKLNFNNNTKTMHETNFNACKSRKTITTFHCKAFHAKSSQERRTRLEFRISNQNRSCADVFLSPH